MKKITCSNRPNLLLLLALYVCMTLSPQKAAADEQVPSDPKPRWWKGNLHTHSLWSDGDDFPEMIAEWYRTNGYNFLALSDHNVMSEGQRWMAASTVESRGGPVCMQKYLARFGPNWVETRSTGDQESATTEIRLKPLNEFRALVETRGEFIMLTGEEISDSSQGKPVHMNATNLRDLIQPLGGETVVDAARANLRAADIQAQKLGREIMVHLNHPNFGYAFTPEELAAVVEEQFFEVYNGHPSVNHRGDENRAGTEPMWDIVNTLRLTKLGGVVMLGIATDDSHDYHENKGATTGRGWVMVQSTHLTPESLVRALKRGDFYASSGVSIDTIEFNEQQRRLTLELPKLSDVTYTTQFIGSRYTESDGSRNVAADQIGVVLDTQTSHTPSYTMKGDELYIRAVVTSNQAHTNPSIKDQLQQAWTQPVGWSPTDQ